MRRILLPCIVLLCALTAVALIATAHALDPDPLPRQAAVIPETPTAIVQVRHEHLFVTPAPTRSPTAAPTWTPRPWQSPQPSPTPTEAFQPEQQTDVRSETQ